MVWMLLCCDQQGKQLSDNSQIYDAGEKVYEKNALHVTVLMDWEDRESSPRYVVHNGSNKIQNSSRASYNMGWEERLTLLALPIVLPCLHKTYQKKNYTLLLHMFDLHLQNRSWTFHRMYYNQS